MSRQVVVSNKKFMHRIFILTIFLIANPSVTDCWFKSSNQSDCPTVSVTCPESDDFTKPMKFKAKVVGRKTHGAVSYNWSITKGTIRNGQGTPVIEVDLNGQDCEGLTATVEINGYDPNCPRVASCTTCLR